MPWNNLSLGNTINYSVDAFPVPFYHGGIWLQQCPNAMITDNIITNTISMLIQISEVLILKIL
jgi:hypothetical protein